MNHGIITLDIDDVLLRLLENCLSKYNPKYNDNLRMEDVTDYNVAQFTKPECGIKFYEFSTRIFMMM